MVDEEKTLAQKHARLRTALERLEASLRRESYRVAGLERALAAQLGRAARLEDDNARLRKRMRSPGIGRAA